ncbi:MAG TPA: hypothetical protein VGS21_04500 [Acidimicrobiales bacterium]|nr:hypothetical protein [Acidimicrobiales bacterium]
MIEDDAWQEGDGDHEDKGAAERRERLSRRTRDRRAATALPPE